MDSTLEELADEAYWQQCLAGYAPFDGLAEHARPAAQPLVIEHEFLRIEREPVPTAGDHEQGLAALTSFVALLHRYSGERDIAIRCDLSCPDALAADSPTNASAPASFVLRAQWTGECSFAQLQEQLRSQLTLAREHSRVSIARVCELLQPDRPVHLPVRFCFRDADSPARTMPSDAPTQGVDAIMGGADLSLRVDARRDGWILRAWYDARRHGRATVKPLLRHYANLLHAGSDDASCLLSRLPMLDDDERGALISAGNDTDTDFPRHSTVPDLVEAQYGRTPDAIALRCGDRQLSYRELDLACRRLAQRLHARGIGRGDKIAVCLERSVELVVALLAVMRAGAAYVPLDPDYPRPRLLQIMQDAGLAAILTDRAVDARLPAHAAPRILIDTDAEVESDTDVPALSGGTPLHATAGPAPDDLAYVIFTSGSTGRPKGVQIEHRALTNLLWAMRERPGLAASDVLVSVTTVSFDIAALELFLPLVVGAQLVVALSRELADGSALLALLRRHRATVLQATPITWQLLLAAGWNGDPCLRMLCGGEALSRPLADALLGQGGELWNLYGPTETTIWSSALRVQAGTGAVPLGGPIANTRFYVCDEHAQLVPGGAAGELLIGGEGVARGYLDRPLLSAERFISDPFDVRPGARLYRTGDQVRRRVQGGFEFLGRKDQQIKLRGFRIELGEIESVLLVQPQVRECVALIAGAVEAERSLHAYVVMPELATDQRAAMVRQLGAELRRVLPGYMCPSALAILDALPRTPNGKVDRAALHMPPMAATAVVEWSPQLSPTEQQVAALWRALLPLGTIAADANFFEVGGHSLLAARLTGQIETVLGCRLSLATVFQHPTLAAQARLIEERHGAGDSRAFDFRQVLRLQAQGARPPLIALNNTGIYYALSRQLRDDQPFISLQLFDPDLPLAELPDTLEGIAAGYVQLIGRVQPTGPCALLGWCVAGTLAFEVARQLRESGRTVSQLLLFDTLVPGYLNRLPWFRALLADYSFRWKLIAADWARARSGPRALRTFLSHRVILRKLRRMLFGASAAERLAARTPDAVAGQVLTPVQYDQWLLRYLEDAAARYEPRPYAGSLTLFRSSQEPMGRFLDLEMGWGPFVQGGIEVLTLDGDHFSIFQKPSVSRMARYIEAALDAVRPYPPIGETSVGP